ncbi:MAG: sugar phosphate isomerase/epimerase [Planctomycetota bacterium]|nr:sugar phosphate isomerase/epimerase [Planctomycetota bacterium]
MRPAVEADGRGRGSGRLFKRRSTMRFCGIADEAGKSIAEQIRAHKELGWDLIEVRNVDGVNLTDLPDDKFEATLSALNDAKLKIACFASQLANWSRPITGDFTKDIEELKRAIPRMHKAGTKYIRCMSYPNDKTSPWPDDKWRDEAVRRLRELAKIAGDGGVVLVHENCSGWGGQGPKQMAELWERVGSPAFQLCYDTGNLHGNDGWKFYLATREHAVHVHIKDYKRAPDGKEEACFPGEGIGRLPEILADLMPRGYEGALSIEPHMASVVHLHQDAKDPDAAYKLYVEYGRRLMALVQSARGMARTMVMPTVRTGSTKGKGKSAAKKSSGGKKRS